MAEIAAHIAFDSPQTARRILEKLQASAEGLDFAPERGRMVPELTRFNIHSLRELIVRPWRIVYEVKDDSVHVVAVLDGRRDLEDILLERLTR